MMRSRGGILSSFPMLAFFLAAAMAFPLDIGVTGQYLYRYYRSVPQDPLSCPPLPFPARAGGEARGKAGTGRTQRNKTMKCKALSALRLLVGLLAFAAGSDQTGGLGLVLAQIEAIGPRQWLNLMAGTIVSGTPMTQQIASALPRRLLPFNSGSGTTA